MNFLSFKKNQLTGLVWILLSVGMSFSWLIPIHKNPWATFYSELFAALIVIPFVIWSLVKLRSSVKLDCLSIGFLVVSFFPLIQSACNIFTFSAEAPIVSLYLLGFACAILFSRRIEEQVPIKLAEALFASLVISSLISTALAIAQVFRLDWGSLVAAIPAGGRPVANVGQPNELSTLLIWGLIGIWYVNLRQNLSALITILLAAILLIGIASTQSRTGWLAVSLILFAGLFSPFKSKTNKYNLTFIGLGIWFFVLVTFWNKLISVTSDAQSLTLEAQLSVGKRPDMWAMMFDGIKHKPWFGYGWNQGRLVQLGELENYSHLKIGVQHAHNIILDLLVWNGIPIGLTLVTLLFAWFIWQIKKIRTFQSYLIMVALGVFLLHSMLELPHTKMFFLVPVALMMGLLNASSKLPSIFSIHRFLFLIFVGVLGGYLILMGIEYSNIEAQLVSYQMRAARIGKLNPIPEPKIVILTGLQSALQNLRIEPRANMNEDDLERLRLTANRYPFDVTFLKYAKASALNGRKDISKKVLLRACLLLPEQDCTAIKYSWSLFVTEHPELADINF
jgi:O-antigen ligase